MTKAVALFSGGLDSTLAILAALKQDIEVRAIRFRTPFDPDADPGESRSYLRSTGEKFGFLVEDLRPTASFFDVVKNPKHGYGKNMNPCIDCRIFMLKEAKRLMSETAADFIITGEVIGQRPMSQRKDMLYHIDKEAGVVGLVLRPLSARLLNATVPEQRGLVKRDMLYAFNGRSRKPQMALAKELGLEDYPSPAGGCLLTEPTYAHRLRDLLTFDSSPSRLDIDLLRLGRHFRFAPYCKIIVGRDERENEIIASSAGNEDCILRVDGCGSPLTLIRGIAGHEAIRFAASVCARYSDAKGLPLVEVSVVTKGTVSSVQVEPVDDELLKSHRIGIDNQKKFISSHMAGTRTTKPL